MIKIDISYGALALLAGIVFLIGSYKIINHSF